MQDANRLRVSRAIATVLAAVLLASCGADTSPDATEPSPVLTAATLGEQVLLSNSENLADSRYVAADPDNGARQAQVCRACHSLERGGPNMLGPNLFGVFGKRTGARADFAYSEVLVEAGFTWTPRALEAWLAQPARFLPGNRMTFAGVLDEGNRVDLVAYLLNVTDDNNQQQ